MIENGLSKYEGKRILMLQGPIGPFFRRLSHDLKLSGADVYKVNFNSGDCFFYPTNYIAFKGDSKEWAGFFESLVTEKKIDVVMLFGDCRSLHRVACKISEKLGIEVGVFEEGYVRPDYLTLDKGGVNGHSKIPKNPDFYFSRPKDHVEPAVRVGQTIQYTLLFAFFYWAAAIFFKSRFPKYRHHRSLEAKEVLAIFPHVWRKYLYKFTERGIQDDLITNHSKKFYLVPLQVYNDSQIIVHSDFVSNQHFLNEVIASFALHAPKDTLLVIKHHPLDRAYNNYEAAIKEFCKKYNVPDHKWRYIHDQHLPSLLSAAKGIILVNSTVGMQALHHKCPMKVCGRAIYDIDGLTFQGELKDFWEHSKDFVVDTELYERFRNYVITHTQLNGSVYRPLNIDQSASGLVWPSRQTQQNPGMDVNQVNQVNQLTLEVNEAS